MKVAFITDYNNHTWIWAQNYNLFIWLKKKWVEIDIINLVSPQWFKGIPNYWININSNIYNNIYLSFWYGVFYKFPKELKKILKKWKYTHIILWHQWLAYLWKKLQEEYKTIIIVHDLFTLYDDKKKWVDEFIYNNFLLKWVNKMKNIVFISEFTKKDYEKYFWALDNQNYRIIYQWIDKQNVDNKIRDQLIKEYNLNDKKIILNVWSEDWRKNIKTYLEVASHFKDRNDIQFVRVWRKSSESEKYINDNNLKNVLYRSWISDEELIAWYDIANIVLSTSTLEWYGRQIFEWYLYNNYVITSDVSDVRKIFQNAWNVLIESDILKISKYIEWIKFNEESKPKLSLIQSVEWEISNYMQFLAIL